MNANSITDKERLHFALLFTMAFLLSIWGVFLIDASFDLGLNAHGNRPREIRGLKGILTYPFLHSGLEHLWNNTTAFFTLNGMLFYFYRSIALRVWGILFVVSGALLWLFGGVGNHIGASGMVYGLASFLFFSGVVRKNVLLLRISLVVVFIYGGLVWWVLPIKEHVSWEGHLAGAVTGAFLAVIYRNRGPKKPIYKFEISEGAHEDLPEWWMRGNPNHPDTITQRARQEREKQERERISEIDSKR
jgi:membrane associated rhomboid family serine protease